jgi:4-hydroxyphenylacetate 3-monooxygenase
MNYAGSHELVRLFPLHQATASGALRQMEELAEQCLADYDEDGWRLPGYNDGADLSLISKGGD